MTTDFATMMNGSITTRKAGDLVPGEGDSLAGPGVASASSLVEGSGIDAKPLNFCFDTDLSKNRQGRKAVILAPADDRQMIDVWLVAIRAESDHEVARRLGITDRQVRRIKTGKVSDARLREHAKADPKHLNARSLG